MDLVIDIGNSRVKAALFQERMLYSAFTTAKEEALHSFHSHLAQHPIQHTLISSVNPQVESLIKHLLDEKKIPYHTLDRHTLKLELEVDEPDALGQDRIANAYGALRYFPLSDCIVVDIGTATTFDYVAKEGKYLGGMIYPGPSLAAKALNAYTSLLPLVSFEKPDSVLAKTTTAHLQAGIYYGQLGAIERAVDELRLTSPSPSSVKVIATGGASQDPAWTEDLKELVDVIVPHLTLIGLREILYERLS
jgi:type III pantothenate kinase